MRRNGIDRNFWIRSFLVFSIIMILQLPIGASELWLKPIPSKLGDPLLMVFLPGARVDAENYQDLLKRVQLQVERPLWVVTFKFLADIPQPFRLNQRVEKVLIQLSSELGTTLPKESVWISGHSLGGINARRIASQYGGLILLSAYFDRLGDRNQSDLKDFDKPVLMLSGELDGLTRPAYLVRDSIYDSTRKNLVDWSKSVLLLPSINHSIFAYDEAILVGDLAAEIEPDQARSMIAGTVASFMNYHDNKASSQLKMKSLEFLKIRKSKSEKLIEPYVKAHLLDSDLCDASQQFLLEKGIPNFTEFTVAPETLEMISQFALSKPTISLNSDGNPIIKTVQFNDRYRNILDRANLSLAPKSTFCKMKSVDAVTDLMWLNKSEAQPKCLDFQQVLIEKTLAYLSPEQKNRYLNSGKTLRLSEEIKQSTGIGWLSSRAPLIDDQDGEYIIRNQSLYTDLHAPLNFAGMTYCRFLPSSRLLDWYLIDSGIAETN